MNQLLTATEIRNTPDGPAWILPAPTTPLPREKPLPKPKEPTKWDKFAAKKGIAPKRKDGKMVYDEDKGEWVPKWGYKGKNKDGEEDWLVEVDEKKEAREGVAGDVRREKRMERKERIRRQERRMRANERSAAKD
jgi:regulator of ribosome biosynthesis